MKFILIATLAACSFVTYAAGIATFSIHDARLADAGEKPLPPLPCRIHLFDEKGKAQRAAGLPFWFDHFVCDGTASVTLEPGKYRYEIESGPEWNAAKGEFTLADGQTVAVAEKLARLANLSAEGWWSGETHIHRSLADIELLMRAEDLHVGAVATWWNNRSEWLKTAVPENRTRNFDGDRFYHVLGGEDERGGGALMLLNLKQPLALIGAAREYPPSVKFLADAKAAGAWVDIEKPFWWDVPIWLATGNADSIGLLNNHSNRGGMNDAEAWGRPRDRNLFPPPHGNGLYSQSLYFHILNCGLRIPPSAGSASGVLPNPVGYNRVYVHLDGPLTYEKWWEGLKAGRAFVTNGPLLRVTANSEWPGKVFKSGGAELAVHLEGRLDSRDKLKSVELIVNGVAVEITLPHTFTLTDSGWFLVRATNDVEKTLRNALTAPWYVEFEGKPQKPARESVQMFLNWTQERGGLIEKALTDPEQRAEALKAVRDAEAFWTKLLK